jgi:ubiquinone/menaquinone biosynthesis C-methylase UbiE
MQNNKGLKDEDSTKKHWENIFSTKNFNEVSWYQENPKTSVDLILSVNLDKDAKIIDVGAGDSKLADNLLNLGFRNISVLDVSSKALEKTKKRLGNKADSIKWIVSDIREFETNDRYDIWHDRAALHFLTADDDIDKYANKVRRFLKYNGYLIISTFSLNGPKRCSGLDIKQYSEASIKKLFYDFEHIKSFEEKHLTPWRDSQIFVYNIFRKKNDKK